MPYQTQKHSLSLLSWAEVQNRKDKNGTSKGVEEKCQAAAAQLDVDAVAICVVPIHQAFQRLLDVPVWVHFDDRDSGAFGDTSRCQVRRDNTAAALEQKV